MSQASPLQELICSRIAHEGLLTFAAYMRMALYEPEYGYYVQGPARMGWRGDYFTSSDISTLFAHCLGRQLAQFWEKLKRPNPLHVLEQGAGRGQLGAMVQAWALAEAPEFARALIYQSADIRSGQDSLQSTTEQTFHVLLSNELIDAFPVHLVEVREHQLFEVYVSQKAGHLHEVLAEPSSPTIANYLDDYKINWQRFPDGWRTEINLDAEIWLRQSVAQMDSHSFLLTIDYGEKARELYTRDRRRGTLLCYRNHQASERPLAYPGEQDITAHVNFSSLIEQGRALGLRLNTYTTQRQWLATCGLQDELTQRRARDFTLLDTQRSSDQGQIALMHWYDLRQRAAILSDPSGLGNFKVLILRR